MDYIALDKAEAPEEKPEEKPAEKPEEKPQESVTGTINCGTAELRVRVAPNGAFTGAYLKTGNKVTILEQKTVGGVLWGRVDKGWIKMEFVILDKTESEPAPGAAKGTVTGDYLRIRTAPGTNNTVVGLLRIGDQVTILETKTVGDMTWGRIQNGWISMDYVRV